MADRLAENESGWVGLGWVTGVTESESMDPYRQFQLIRRTPLFSPAH